MKTKTFTFYLFNKIKIYQTFENEFEIEKFKMKYYYIFNIPIFSIQISNK